MWFFTKSDSTDKVDEEAKSTFFYSQFRNENFWYRMHSQHSVHSAPGSRTVEWHSVHSGI